MGRDHARRDASIAEVSLELRGSGKIEALPAEISG